MYGKNTIDQLSDHQIELYARHLVLPEIGVKGQIALTQTRIAIIGCGGLGANAALALTQAGIGVLELYDPDEVELSNLHRQPFTHDQIGLPKAEALAQLCQARNYETQIQTFVQDFAGSPAPLWLDCTDSEKSRRLVEGLRTHKTTLVFGSVIGMDAQISVFLPGSPGFSDLFPPLPEGELSDGDLSDGEFRQTCAEQGVLGPLASLTAQIMATEALKLAHGKDSTLSHNLLLIDARDWRLFQIAK